MADDIDVKISDALMTKVGALVLSPVLPVAYPSVAFPGVNVDGSAIDLPESFLDVTEFRNTPEEVTHAEDRYRGILQVEVAVPLQSGNIPAMTIAGKVREHFKRGTWISNGGIVVRIDRAFVGSGYAGKANNRREDDKDDGRWRVPVTIRWFCQTAI